jgi:hypothetical protein
MTAEGFGDIPAKGEIEFALLREIGGAGAI